MSYSKKISYIYISQVCSIALGMLSLLIVSPFVTSNKEVYGIYAVCLSLTVFFAYADIGFVSASQKFAAEAYIRGEKVKEMQILGFSLMILLLFMGVIFTGVLLIAYNPEWLIQGVNGENRIIARQLLLILAGTIPFYCLRRIFAVVFSVRMQDYYLQVMSIVGSFLTIAVAPFFFLSGKYDIVGYYLTSQLLHIATLLVSILIAKYKLGVDVLLLITSIKFSREIYNLLSGLAYASLFVTLCWILYYELDNIVIARLLGSEAVATFAVAFTLLTVFRSLFGILYGPFQTRFNYFIGLGDLSGLHTFAKKLMKLYLPVCVVPIIVMFIVAKPFLYSWVGPAYDESAPVLSALMLCNVMAFISYPSGIYITAVKQNRYLYYTSIVTVVVYWVGVFSFYQTAGVLAFATMKAIAMIVTAFYSYFVMFYLMKESGWVFLLKMVKMYIIPTVLLVGLCMVTEPYMMFEKGRDYLLVNIGIIILLGGIGYLIYLGCSSFLRKEAVVILGAVLVKKKKDA